MSSSIVLVADSNNILNVAVGCGVCDALRAEKIIPTVYIVGGFMVYLPYRNVNDLHINPATTTIQHHYKQLPDYLVVPFYDVDREMDIFVSATTYPHYTVGELFRVVK